MIKCALKTRLAKVPEVDFSEIKLPVVKAFNPFRVRPLPEQIREQFVGIYELAASIKALTQILPIVVTEIEGNPDYDAQLVDGERRLEACKHLKRGVVAFLWDGKTNVEDLYALSVAANCNRQGHNVVEFLHAIQRFMKHGKTQEQIAQIFGKSQGWVSQHYLLRNLHPTVLSWLIPVPIGESNGDGNGDVSGKKKTKPSGGLRLPSGALDLTNMKSIGSDKMKAPLSFQLAMNLAQRPMELQVAAGREIISKKMSLAEAKRYLAQAERGVQTNHRHRPPSERRSTFMSVASRVEHMVGTYSDMPYAEIKGLLSSMTNSDLARTANALDRVSEYSASLAQQIRRNLEERQGLVKQEVAN